MGRDGLPKQIWSEPYLTLRKYKMGNLLKSEVKFNI